MTRSLQKAVATSCNLATTRPATTTERIDLEATCHCRLSLASRHVRSRPSRSLTYVSIHPSESDLRDDVITPPTTYATPPTHNTPHPSLASLGRSISWGQRPLLKSWSIEEPSTTFHLSVTDEAERMNELW